MEINLDNIVDNSVESMKLFSGNPEDLTDFPEVTNENENTDEIIDDQLLDITPKADSGGVDRVENQVQEDVQSKPEKGHSPNNLYFSIAKDLLEEGILELDESDITEVNSGEALVEMFKKHVNNLLTEDQKRISEALNNNVPVDTVRQYENVIRNLEGITNDQLEDDDKGEELRKSIIYNDYIIKGFTEQRAKREVEKSLNAGTDIEDAKEALTSLTSHYRDGYKEVIEASKAEQNEMLAAEKKQLEDMKNRFINTEEPIKGLKLSKTDREKMYQQATKIVAKTDDGKPLTTIQNYALNNPIDYQYYINLLFYQTNGFKDLSKAIKKEVNTQTKATMTNLERVIKNSGNNFDSGLSFENSMDSNSYKGLRLALD